MAMINQTWGKGEPFQEIWWSVRKILVQRDYSAIFDGGLFKRSTSRLLGLAKVERKTRSRHAKQQIREALELSLCLKVRPAHLETLP